MSDKLLSAVAVLLAALIAGLGLFWHPEAPARPLPVPALPAGGDFTLQSAGGPVALADFRGKVVLLDFGYTYCPDICPTALAATAEAIEQLEPDERARFAALFVSVDPQRDTPARLREYTAFFHPAIVGVTGSAEQVADVARRYGAFYARQPADTAGGYVVDHSADLYVVDRDGRVVDKLAHGTPPVRIASALRRAMTTH